MSWRPLWTTTFPQTAGWYWLAFGISADKLSGTTIVRVHRSDRDGPTGPLRLQVVNPAVAAVLNMKTTKYFWGPMITEPSI